MNDNELKMPEENFLGKTPTTERRSGVVTILLFAIVLLLIGILGALLWWGSFYLQTSAPAIETVPEVTRPTAEENDEPESTNAEAVVETMQAVSSSDELIDIVADFQSTPIDAIDKELQKLENELNSALP